MIHSSHNECLWTRGLWSPSSRSFFVVRRRWCRDSVRITTVTVRAPTFRSKLTLHPQIERFRAGHFTCKNTDWEKWREPKVEPETTDWALHTRIPVWIEQCWALAFFDCSWVLIDRRCWRQAQQPSANITAFPQREFGKTVGSSVKPSTGVIYLVWNSCQQTQTVIAGWPFIDHHRRRIQNHIKLRQNKINIHKHIKHTTQVLCLSKVKKIKTTWNLDGTK